LAKFFLRKTSLLHRHLLMTSGSGAFGEAQVFIEPPLPRFRPYLRNLDTKGEVSPRRRKWPEGPSPKNSENHDSCSISSLRIDRDKS
jgi:hypothetical protein